MARADRQPPAGARASPPIRPWPQGPGTDAGGPPRGAAGARPWRPRVWLAAGDGPEGRRLPVAGRRGAGHVQPSCRRPLESLRQRARDGAGDARHGLALDVSAVARAVRSGRLNPEATVPALGLALAALIVLVGQAIKAAGGQLGAFFPPFYVRWDPHVGPLAAVAVATALGAAAVTPRWVQRARRPPPFAAGLFALALALGVSLNIARGGFHELWAIFQRGPGGSPEAGNEN